MGEREGGAGHRLPGRYLGGSLFTIHFKCTRHIYFPWHTMNTDQDCAAIRREFAESIAAPDLSVEIRLRDIVGILWRGAR